jgi:2-isopropylmalate synthase
MKDQDIIYDWNTIENQPLITRKNIEFHDETLRDGIQSPSVVDPDIDSKISLVHLMEDLGINSVNIGLPGAGKRAYMDVYDLASDIVNSRLKIIPTCAARTIISDIEPIVEISQKVGKKIEVMTFIGSSPIRQYTENWDVDFLLKTSEQAIKFSVKNNLPTTYVTEDTTRSKPEVLEKLFKHVINLGAKRLILCDTVGHATPDGLTRLINFTQSIIKETGEDIKIDWHGHNDRALALPNALSAIEAGADRIHGTALGIGERVGNTSLDQLLVNLKLLKILDRDLSKLIIYCDLASKATHVPIPKNYPVVGSDAFRTGTGVHASAIIKAKTKGDDWLADRIYSGVPASFFGLKQKIEISHMSGESNVIYYLKERGIEPKDEVVKKILDFAKKSNRTLTKDEVLLLINEK